VSAVRSAPPVALAVAASVALVLVLALALGPALPAPRTALGDRLLALLDVHLVKVITGSAAAGLAALSLLLSLRKRIRRLASIGSMTFWRAFHGGAGALASLATLLHTGGRLGSHVNLALSIVFLTGLGTGAAAGLFRRGPLARIHLYVLWPLPVLLGLHLLTVLFYS
jgi:nitrite reductase (NADH) large subunit